MANYTIGRNGLTIGNYEDAQIQAMLSAGNLLPTDVAWQQGMPEWKPIGVLFPGATPPAMPGATPPVLPPGVSQAAQFVPPAQAPHPLLAMVIPIGRSGWAIAAGYFGLFSLIFFMAPFAILFGILAIRDIKKNPEKLGLGRAWFGIIAGTISVVCWGSFFISMSRLR
jgi:hypothetical protein